MATKSGLTNAIDTALSIVITKAKVLTGLGNIVNELFPSITTQTINTGTNVFYCSLKYKKIGNTVYVHGYVQNKYSTSQQTTNMITIPNSLFYAKTGEDTIDVGVTENTSSNVLISFSTSSIYLIGSLAPNQKIYINSQYTTND